MPRGELLVAILNKPLDFTLLRKELWYRIPASSVEKWLKGRWPPQWLAFYQTKIFGDEAYSINYFTEVVDIRKVQRWQLFPDGPRDLKSERQYYQLFVKPIQPLHRPILSRRRRRIIFISSTLQKFIDASEINDLYDESVLEDHLWAEFKRLKISAERQEFVRVKSHDYALDFAIYCAKGKIDVETDGDVWHANPERAAQDNLRDNALETVGWKVLRFSSQQIQDETQNYAIPTIAENINNLSGVVEEGKLIPRKIDLNAPTGSFQLSLFDD